MIHSQRLRHLQQCMGDELGGALEIMGSHIQMILITNETRKIKTQLKGYMSD